MTPKVSAASFLFALSLNSLSACDGEAKDSVAIGKDTSGTIGSDTSETTGDTAPPGDTFEVPIDVDGDGVPESEDCDDADATVYPGADEICGDGIDQDCDGSDLLCPGEVSADTAYAAGRGVGEAGDQVRPGGDMNGDGLDDLVIGETGYNMFHDWPGAVLIIFSPVPAGNRLLDAENSILLGDGDDNVGEVLSRGEDLDGDGWPDLAIGAYGHYDASTGLRGGAYVVYGPPPVSLDLMTADGLILSDDPYLSRLGNAISSSPDLTGDGVGDVVLGSEGSTTDEDRGAAWVVPGPVSGTVTLADAITLSGAHPNDVAGATLDGVGDVNGDGVSDLIVGAYGDDTAGDAAGAAAVFYGPLDGDASLADADRTLTGESAGDGFSAWSVHGRGDVDGDGVGDLMVSATAASPSGAAYLFLGDPVAPAITSASAATARIYGEDADTYVGSSTDLAGDTDADGYDDVLVGGLGPDPWAGEACLFYGPVSGTLSAWGADLRVDGSDGDDWLGMSVAGVGDTNGDGRSDLLIGAPYAYYGDGAVYFFLGG